MQRIQLVLYRRMKYFLHMYTYVAFLWHTMHKIYHKHTGFVASTSALSFSTSSLTMWRWPLRAAIWTGDQPVCSQSWQKRYEIWHTMESLLSWTWNRTTKGTKGIQCGKYPSKLQCSIPWPIAKGNVLSLYMYVRASRYINVLHIIQCMCAWFKVLHKLYMSMVNVFCAYMSIELVFNRIRCPYILYISPLHIWSITIVILHLLVQELLSLHVNILNGHQAMFTMHDVYNAWCPNRSHILLHDQSAYVH